MPIAARHDEASLSETCGAALAAAETLLAEARAGVAAMVTSDGRIDAAALEREQHAVHGFAWYATYVTGKAAEAWFARGKTWGPDGPRATVRDILDSLDRDSMLREARREILATLERKPGPNAGEA